MKYALVGYGRMGKAIEMYRRHGFYEIEPYNVNPYEMIFMERML